MIVSTVVFAVMSHHYQYVDEDWPTPSQQSVSVAAADNYPAADLHADCMTAEARDTSLTDTYRTRCSVLSKTLNLDFTLAEMMSECHSRSLKTV